MTRSIIGLWSCIAASPWSCEKNSDIWQPAHNYDHRHASVPNTCLFSTLPVSPPFWLLCSLRQIPAAPSWPLLLSSSYWWPCIQALGKGLGYVWWVQQHSRTSFAKESLPQALALKKILFCLSLDCSKCALKDTSLQRQEVVRNIGKFATPNFSTSFRVFFMAIIKKRGIFFLSVYLSRKVVD